MIHHQSYLSARIVVMKIHQNSIRIIRLFFESTHFNSIQKILAEFHTIGDVVVTICPFPGFVGLLTKMPFLRLFPTIAFVQGILSTASGDCENKSC